jgi:prepilin-type N-terminal cleavage/methylation domain-containing protein
MTLEATARPKRGAGAGFTLMELMIVVAIIAVVASIAIPSLLNSRKSANEAAAIGDLEGFVSEIEMFRTRFGTVPRDIEALREGGFAAQFEPDPEDAVRFSNGSYTFIYAAPSPTTFLLIAFPEEFGVTGDRNFAYTTHPPLPIPKAIFLMAENGGGEGYVPLD